MRRVSLFVTLIASLVLLGAPTLVYAEDVVVVEPHVSAPAEEAHPSTSEEETTGSHSSSSSSEEESTSTYHGTTYHNNSSSSDEYYNTTGVRVWYWLYVSHGNYYTCYDQNHNPTTCNRQPKTVSHAGVTYTSSTPYTDTANATVRYYFTRYNNTNGNPWYACFDSGFNRISCNRK